jgi:hypothetical protein
MPKIFIATTHIGLQTFEERLEAKKVEIELLKAVKLGQTPEARLKDLQKCLHICKEYTLELINHIITNVEEDNEICWKAAPVLVALPLPGIVLQQPPPPPPPGGVAPPPPGLQARQDLKYTLDKLLPVLAQFNNQSKQDVIDKLIKEIEIINREERTLFENIAKKQYEEFSQPVNIERCEELIKVANKVKDSNTIIQDNINAVISCNAAKREVFLMDLKSKLPGVAEADWLAVANIVNNMIKPRTLLEEYKALQADLRELKAHPRLGGDYITQLKATEKRYNKLTDRLKRLVPILPAIPVRDITNEQSFVRVEARLRAHNFAGIVDLATRLQKINEAIAGIANLHIADLQEEIIYIDMLHRLKAEYMHLDEAHMGLDEIIELHRAEQRHLPIGGCHINAQHLDEIMQSSNPAKLITYDDLVLIEQKEREELRRTPKTALQAEKGCIKEFLDHMVIRSSLKFIDPNIATEPLAALQRKLVTIPGATTSAADIFKDLTDPNLKLFVKDSEIPQDPSGQKMEVYLAPLTAKLKELSASIATIERDKRGWKARQQTAARTVGQQLAVDAAIANIAKLEIKQQALKAKQDYLLLQQQNIISQAKSTSYQIRLITTEKEHLLQQHSKYISVLEQKKKAANRIQPIVPIVVDVAEARRRKEEQLCESFFVGVTGDEVKQRAKDFETFKYITDDEYMNLLKNAIIPGIEIRHIEIVGQIREKLQVNKTDVDGDEIEIDSELQRAVFEQVIAALKMQQMTTSEFEEFFLGRDPLETQNKLVVLTGNDGDEGRTPKLREIPIQESRAHFLAVLDGQARNEWFFQNVAGLNNPPEQLISKNFTAAEMQKILLLPELQGMPRPFNPLDEAHNTAFMVAIRDLSSAGSDQFNTQEPELKNSYFLLKLEGAISSDIIKRPIISDIPPYTFVLPTEFKSAYQTALEAQQQALIAPVDMAAVVVVNNVPVRDDIAADNGVARPLIEQLIRELSAELLQLDRTYDLHNQGRLLGKTEIFDALMVQVRETVGATANTSPNNMLALRQSLRPQINALSSELQVLSERKRQEAEESRRQAEESRRIAELRKAREEAAKVAALERVRVEEAAKVAAQQSLQQHRVELVRVQQAAAAAAALVVQQQATRIDPETARRQKIDALIKAKDYSTAMTFFRDREEALAKVRTLAGTESKAFGAVATKSNWTLIASESLASKQQRSLPKL